MNALSRLIMLAAASATGSWLFAAEPEPVAPTQAETPVATATPPAAEPAPTDEKGSQEQEKEQAASEADKGAAEKGSAAKGSPQRFIPSEQVRADFDVSFPIDI